VLNTAAATLKAWQEMPATRGLELAVNISPHQLSNAGFVTMVADALARAGADPSKLTLELTEHVMLHDIAEVSRSMGKLKEMGVKFALDDFGTGYSSLTYLKRLPIDTLKIDRSFISDLEANRNDRAIVQTILNIAASLEVKVVAEGVETEAQVAILRDLGCRAYQGYFYGRPMRHEAFLAFLAPPELWDSAPATA
jgi:EAL domain-containing protein (putative c-di-GMP-specific phosphodiesterase class I)